MRAFSLLLAICLLPVSVAAQDDVIAKARAAPRAEGIRMLEGHLASNPRDVDARLVFGLLLSWEGRYDEARAALQQVLDQAPDYLDARVALMNVEWWSGNRDAARTLVNQILTKDPGHEQARLVQQRLDAKSRPWSAAVTMTHDTFDDHREPWLETAITLGRETAIGSLFVRGSDANRYGLSDQLIEVEFYPKFRAGTYAFIGIGYGADQVLYPEKRFSFDFYQSLGHGFEGSVGYRQLDFSTETKIFLTTLTKYQGNWMLTGKASLVPDDKLGDSWSYHAEARRYFGAEGTSYWGGSYSHGISREEPRGRGDIVPVDADTFRIGFQADVTPMVRVSGSAGTGRQERNTASAFTQTTMSAELKLRF